MAPLRTLLAGLSAVVCLLVADASSSATTSVDNFADTKIKENGETYDVADPYGDPSESDSIQQDSTAEWQSEMVKGLYAQRTAEKDFIDRLEAGGNNLNKMVDNITIAFKILESARQQKGSELIRAHFQNEVKLLNQSQHEILANLSSILTVKSSDSAALKSMKAQVTKIIMNKFVQQIRDESTLFKAQMEQIKQEHAKQISHVKELFSLINGWKDAFRKGLKKSEANLEKIAQSWDLL